MKTITLVARCDEDTGELGLQIEGAHGYEVNSASEGLLIAHDLIEHPSVEGLGRIDEELEAIGAIWVCRGRHGELRRDHIGSWHSIEANIASDLTRMFVDWANGADTIMLDLPRRTRAHEHDEAFAAIIDIARRDIPRELESSGRIVQPVSPCPNCTRWLGQRYVACTAGSLARHVRPPNDRSKEP